MWRFGGLALAFVLGACQESSGPAAGAVDLAAAGSSGQSDLQLVSSLPAPVGTNQGRDVPIARDDLLKIDVFQVDELDRTVRVDSNGRISLALIGMVDAAGKTVPELEHDIEKIYGVKYLQNPEVSVFVQESAGQQVTVNGAVRSPGIYPISSTATLLQVIAQAALPDDFCWRRHLLAHFSIDFNVTRELQARNKSESLAGRLVPVIFRSVHDAEIKPCRIVANRPEDALNLFLQAIEITESIHHNPACWVGDEVSARLERI